MNGAGVQIDDMARQVDDLLAEQRSHPRAQRSGVAAREATIEIAPVRQVTGVLDEAEDVDDGHRDQRPAQPADRRRTQQPADDLGAVDLVAVDRPAHQQHRPGLATVHHFHRNMQRCMGIEFGHRDVELCAGAWRDAHTGEFEGSSCHSPSLM